MSISCQNGAKLKLFGYKLKGWTNVNVIYSPHVNLFSSVEHKRTYLINFHSSCNENQMGLQNIIKKGMLEKMICGWTCSWHHQMHCLECHSKVLMGRSILKYWDFRYRCGIERIDLTLKHWWHFKNTKISNTNAFDVKKLSKLSSCTKRSAESCQIKKCILKY